MADINVERKRGSNAVVWIVGILVLLVAAFLVWTFLAGGTADTANDVPAGPPASTAAP